MGARNTSTDRFGRLRYETGTTRGVQSEIQG